MWTAGSRLFSSETLGDGQDEQPLPFVRRTHFRRREQARRNLVTQSAKLIVDRIEAQT